MRRNDVASTPFRRRVPIRFLINQCQIITFLVLKYDIIENSRIELRGIVLPVQMGGLLGGPKGMLAPLSNYWGGGLPPPWPPLFLRLCIIMQKLIQVKPIQRHRYSAVNNVNKYTRSIGNCKLIIIGVGRGGARGGGGQAPPNNLRGGANIPFGPPQ